MKDCGAVLWQFRFIHYHRNTRTRAWRQTDGQTDEHGRQRRTQVFPLVQTEVSDVKLRCRAVVHAKQFKETVVAAAQPASEVTELVSRRKCCARYRKTLRCPIRPSLIDTTRAYLASSILIWRADYSKTENGENGVENCPPLPQSVPTHHRHCLAKSLNFKRDVI